MWICIALHREHASSALPPPLRRRSSPSPSSSARHQRNRAIWASVSRDFAYPRRDGTGWVDLGAWFCTEVTHPGTNRAWRRVTTLIKTNVLPLSQPATKKRLNLKGKHAGRHSFLSNSGNRRKTDKPRQSRYPLGEANEWMCVRLYVSLSYSPVLEWRRQLRLSADWDRPIRPVTLSPSSQPTTNVRIETSA